MVGFIILLPFTSNLLTNLLNTEIKPLFPSVPEKESTRTLELPKNIMVLN